MIRYPNNRLARAVMAGALLAPLLPIFSADICAAPPQQDAPAAERRAAAGDVLRVVLTDPETGKEQVRQDATVDKDGLIKIPYIGRYRVAGMTAAEVQKSLEKVYGPNGVNIRTKVAVRFIAPAA